MLLAWHWSVWFTFSSRYGRFRQYISILVGLDRMRYLLWLIAGTRTENTSAPTGEERGLCRSWRHNFILLVVIWRATVSCSNRLEFQFFSALLAWQKRVVYVFTSEPAWNENKSKLGWIDGHAGTEDRLAGKWRRISALLVIKIPVGCLLYLALNIMRSSALGNEFVTDRTSVTGSL